MRGVRQFWCPILSNDILGPRGSLQTGRSYHTGCSWLQLAAVGCGLWGLLECYRSFWVVWFQKIRQMGRRMSGEIAAPAVHLTIMSKGAMQCPTLLWNWIDSEYSDHLDPQHVSLAISCVYELGQQQVPLRLLTILAWFWRQLTNYRVKCFEVFKGQCFAMFCHCVGLPFGLSEEGFTLTKRLQDLALKPLHRISEVFKTMRSFSILILIWSAYSVCIRSQDNNMPPIQATVHSKSSEILSGFLDKPAFYTMLRGASEFW